MILFNTMTLGAFLLMTFANGILSAVGLIAVGYSLNATATANITMTHKIVPNHVSMGTGMIMGFASTIAGIAMLGFGGLADLMGLVDAAQLFNVLLFVSILISVMLPKEFSENVQVEGELQ